MLNTSGTYGDSTQVDPDIADRRRRHHRRPARPAIRGRPPQVLAASEHRYGGSEHGAQLRLQRQRHMRTEPTSCMATSAWSFSWAASRTEQHTGRAQYDLWHEWIRQEPARTRSRTAATNAEPAAAVLRVQPRPIVPRPESAHSLDSRLLRLARQHAAAHRAGPAHSTFTPISVPTVMVVMIPTT